LQAAVVSKVAEAKPLPGQTRALRVLQAGAGNAHPVGVSRSATETGMPLATDADTSALGRIDL